MPAPNFEQISSFDKVDNQLKQAAIDEFMSFMYDGISHEEVIDAAIQVAQKFAMLGAELGAQWYDLCTELAGIDADPAELPETDPDGIGQRAADALASAGESGAVQSLREAITLYLSNEIENSIRMTGSANLWRDYERGLCGGRWARVPVGETCAWCMMLASQGAWYLSEKTALGPSPDHYHEHCNCKAVYHATPDSIEGYSELLDYKHKYYTADNMRRANDSGREPYPEELANRIAAAKLEHAAKVQRALDNGKEPPVWTVYNEDLIVMRYEYGLK